MALAIDLAGKVALITGVSAGIGRGIAISLAKAGCKIAGCAVESEDHPDVVQFTKEITAEGEPPLYRQLDVTHTDKLKDFVVETARRFGKIDILVSNAGMNVFTQPENCTEDEWDFNHQLNLAAHWRLSKICYPYLKAGGEGVVIIISSNHSFTSLKNCFPYNVAKTALNGLVRALAIQWGPDIRAVGIAPGFIQTKKTQPWFDTFPDSAAKAERIINQHPTKSLGTTEQIGALTAFLVSDYSAFITGTTYLVDGGVSALMNTDE
ncbi:MAG: SDR family oxidoreductase [Bacteroidota bacterium]